MGNGALWNPRTLLYYTSGTGKKDSKLNNNIIDIQRGIYRGKIIAIDVLKSCFVHTFNIKLVWINYRAVVLLLGILQ